MCDKKCKCQEKKQDRVQSFTARDSAGALVIGYGALFPDGTYIYALAGPKSAVTVYRDKTRETLEKQWTYYKLEWND